MQSTRKPANVIDQILKYVPEGMWALREKLLMVRRYATYLPPEYYTPAWKGIREALVLWLNVPPLEKWEEAILSIMEGNVTQEVSVVPTYMAPMP